MSLTRFLWRVLSVLVPALFGIFNRYVYEDIDGRITKSAGESQPGRIAKTIEARISTLISIGWNVHMKPTI